MTGLIRHPIYKFCLLTKQLVHECNQDPLLSDFLRSAVSRQQSLPFSNNVFQRWRQVAEGSRVAISVQNSDGYTIWAQDMQSLLLIPGRNEYHLIVDKGVFWLASEHGG